MDKAFKGCTLFPLEVSIDTGTEVPTSKAAHHFLVTHVFFSRSIKSSLQCLSHSEILQ